MQNLKNQADKCVQCGLCLTVCPTYYEAKTEAESPRGRILLMQALIKGTWDTPSPAVFEHLDRCLHCGACETVCPAEVPYLDLLENTLQAYPSSWADRRTPIWLKFFRMSLHFPKAYPLFTWLFWFFQFLPLLPKQPLPRRLPPHSPSTQPLLHRGPLILMTGCALSFFDSQLLKAAQELFCQLGFDVLIPPEQSCCGALDAQHGRQKQALSLQSHQKQLLQNWFNRYPKAPLVSLSPGCFKAYQQANLAWRVLDWTEVLIPILTELPFKKTTQSQTWVLHQPCSTLPRFHQNTLTLLRAIPHLKIHVMPPRCCGSAGDYAAKYPELAGKLADQTWKHFAEKQHATSEVISGLLTANIGCALHLQKKTFPFSSKRPRLEHPLLFLKSML